MGSTILLLGVSGQLGWELRRTLAPLGHVVAPARAELDLRQPEHVRERVRSIRPAVVVNAAAYTDVDGAESEPGMAFTVNADGPAILASEAVRAGAVLVHFSTDYVFDGAAVQPYRETDVTRPLNVYGASKLEGEQAVVAAGGEHLILRTAWLYGGPGRNFLRTILRLARECNELAVVDDQIGCPTWCRMVAEATAAVLSRISRRGEHDSGIYHVCAPDHASWYEFACEIVTRDPRRHEQLCRDVRAVTTAEMPRPAARPAFSALDATRFADAFGLRLPSWREQLALAMDAGAVNG